MNELVNLKQIVSEIKFFENQAVVSYWEIGKRLSQAKEQVGHGNWYDWVDENLGYSRRVTQQLIKIGDSISNPNTYSHLTFSKALALTSIKDEEERQDFIDSHEVEDMTTRKLQEEIKSYKKSLKAKEEELDSTKRELEQEKNREPEIVKKEVVQKIKPKDYDYLKSENKKLEEHLNKQIEINEGLRAKEKYAISQLESEKAHKKIVSDVMGLHTRIAGFIQNVGGLLYLTDYIDDLTDKNKKLFLDSIKYLREFSEQLYTNVEDNLKEK